MSIGPSDQGRDWSTARLLWAGAGCALLALVVAVLVVAQDLKPLAIDEALNSFINGWARGWGWPVQAAAWLGDLTGPVGATLTTAVAVIVLLAVKRYRWAIFLAVTAIFGVLAAEIVKVSVARLRPLGAEPYAHDLEKSFPSGHAMAGIYVYGSLAVLILLLAASKNSASLRGVGIALAVFAFLIGISRLVLGVHWLSDVVAGWLLGGAVLLLSLALIHPERAVLPLRKPTPGPKQVSAPRQTPAKGNGESLDDSGSTDPKDTR